MRAKSFLILLIIHLSFSLCRAFGPNDVEPNEMSHVNFASQGDKSSIRILNTSPNVDVHLDHKDSQIKIGKCEILRDTDTQEQNHYCDFLNGGVGKIFSFFIEFQGNIKALKLSQILAKDQIEIKLNGQAVYNSTGGPSFSITTNKFFDAITDEPFNYYLGIPINGQLHPIQSQRVLNVNPNITLTEHLKPDINRLEFQVAVGYKGGYQIVLNAIEDKQHVQYPCEDIERHCSQEAETRLIGGIHHHRDCWQYKSIKKCHYPSKNDCHLYKNCLPVRDIKCLLYDQYDNCVNILKEFACQVEDEVYKIQRPKYEGITDDKGAPGTIKCHGLPCFDGICGQPSFDKDTDMMPSLSYLSVANAARGKDLNSVNLFSGMSLKCLNKVTSYSNCCKVRAIGRNKGSGWGHKIGAKCSKNEQYLADLRYQNLCVYIGKTNERALGIKTLERKHFCCWSNMLDKIIQVEGRKQLGIGFGSPESPSCEGLNLEQLIKIDFSKIDFSPFYPSLLNKIKLNKSLNHFSTNPGSDTNRFDVNTGIVNNLTPNEVDENYYE